MMITTERQAIIQTPVASPTTDECITIGELYDALGTVAYRTIKATAEVKEMLLVDAYNLTDPLNLLSASAERNDLTVLPDVSNAIDVASLLLHDAFNNRESIGNGTSWIDYLLTN